eukprot:UN06180
MKRKKNASIFILRCSVNDQVFNLTELIRYQFQVCFSEDGGKDK